MNQTHIHLLITHLPIFGSMIGAFVLLYGIWSSSIQTKIASYLVLIISSLGAIVSYLTGEAAEETVEEIQGITKTIIEQHADFAVFAIIGLSVLGAMSIIGLILVSLKSSYEKAVSTLILLIALVSFAIVARTGYLGGQIRHTEISSVNANANNTTNENNKGKDKDD
ncbi:MAG: hypothetical protein WCG74_07010 [Sediminibacterium sp.]